jgi:diguanylate cyclase (GGDEF)-like protein
VLKDVAYRLRKQVRAFESAYRVGGEEFLILVPGADLVQTRKLAELLRGAVAGSTVGDGQRVTMSFGVAASRQSTGFDYGTVYEEADAALYEAKRAGRNLVCAGSRAEADHPQAALQPANSPEATPVRASV